MQVLIFSIDNKLVKSITEMLSHHKSLNIISVYTLKDCVETLKSANIKLLFLDIFNQNLSVEFLSILYSENIKLIFIKEDNTQILKNNNQTSLSRNFTKADIDSIVTNCLTSEITPIQHSINKIESDSYFFIKTDIRLQKVNTSDILFIEGMGDYLKIHTNKNGLMALLSFRQITDLLPSECFSRIHKSYIIAIDKIDVIEKNKVKIGSVSLPISSSYKKDFFEMIEKKRI